MDFEKRIKKIINVWFYDEPVLFSAICTHAIVKNEGISVPFRSGAMRIEYSPEKLVSLSEEEVTEYLKIEVFRILLQHPYKRQVRNAHKNILRLASDLVINSLYKTSVPLEGVEYLKSLTRHFKEDVNPLGPELAGCDEEKFFMRNLNIDHRTGRFYSTDKLSFEEWYRHLVFLIYHISTKGGENAGLLTSAEEQGLFDSADLWEENEDAARLMQQNIVKAEIDEGWGTNGGNLRRELCAEVDFSMDYRRMLSKFRQNIISASRTLTRMKPSRRFGFKAMGSRYDRKADILIAVDVSGSITDESFSRFFHAIKNIFFLGIIEKIDMIFFDTSLKNSKPLPFSKSFKFDTIEGRGGTDFQCAVDFFESHSEYNGMIVFTDGEGSVPDVRTGRNILWILTDRASYEKSKNWINTLKGNTCSFIPV